MTEREQLERHMPRISLNSLAEYLTASASRRSRIIRDQKYPPDFKITMYADAEEAIVGYLSAGDRDLDRIYRVQEELLGKLVSPKSDWDETRIKLCIEALDSFVGHIEKFDLEDAVMLALPERHVTKLVISGVEISIRPEIGFTVDTRNGLYSGLIKLYFRKNDPLTEEQAQYIGTAMYTWRTDVVSQEPLLHPSQCLLYDVFAGRAFSAPRAVKRRLADIQAACQEIIRLWPHA